MKIQVEIDIPDNGCEEFPHEERTCGHLRLAPYICFCDLFQTKLKYGGKNNDTIPCPECMQARREVEDDRA